jgi:hypothetical protein
MFLTDVTMILIITVLPIFLIWVWLRSEHLHYFSHYFRRQPEPPLGPIPLPLCFIFQIDKPPAVPRSIRATGSARSGQGIFP